MTFQFPYLPCTVHTCPAVVHTTLVCCSKKKKIIIRKKEYLMESYAIGGDKLLKVGSHFFFFFFFGVMHLLGVSNPFLKMRRDGCFSACVRNKIGFSVGGLLCR